MSLAHQIRLIPSGCQSWNRNIITSSPSGSIFSYCSTLAVFIFDGETRRFHKLIAAHERTVTCIEHHPDENKEYLFVTCGADCRAVVWNAQTEKEFRSLDLPSVPFLVQFCPADPDLVSLVLDDGSVRLWRYMEKVESVKAARTPSNVTCMRWNHYHIAQPKAARLALGDQDGRVHIWDPNSSKVLAKIAPSDAFGGDRPMVSNIEWDPLSNEYLIVTYEGGFMSLIDVAATCVAVSSSSLTTGSGKCSVAMDFEQQGVNVKMVAFLRHVPGGFVTVNGRSPVITVWNVSQPAPLDAVRLKDKTIGFTALKPMTDCKGQDSGHTFLAAFKDGSVSIIDLDKRAVVFTTQPGHSETIFDCRFKPSSSHTLATASYDGTVKVWDTRSMSCERELVGQRGVLYAVSWAPGADDHRLASASSKGEVFIWDSATGRVLKRLRNHSSPCYRLAWNPLNAKHIVSTSSDCMAIVFTPDGRLVRKYKHPSKVYGCDWSPFDAHVFVTGCHDGIVRVFDLRDQGTEPKVQMSGHTQRVFNTVWSPLLKNHIASGADDRTVRVWDTAAPSRATVLTGHSSNVRALVWSTEVPFLLLSGSWDGTIRLWDVRTATCLQVVTDHHADVYGLCAHADRPFVYVSSSRDTSLRFWSMEKYVQKLCLSAVVNDGVVQPQYVNASDDPRASVPHGSMASSGMVRSPSKMNLLHEDVHVCGPTFTALAQAGRRTRLQLFQRFFNTLSASPGTQNLWELIDSLVTGRPCSPECVIPHLNDLHSSGRAEAKSLELVRNVGRARRRELMLQSAEIHIKLGNVKEYCEILVAQDCWERAIAIAPAHSKRYWRELCSRYGEMLASRGDEDAVAFLIAARESEQLTDLFLGAFRDPRSALLVASARAQDELHARRGLVDPEEHDERPSRLPVPDDQLPPINQSRAERYSVSSPASPDPSPSPSAALYDPDDLLNAPRPDILPTPQVLHAARVMADGYFLEAQPILAACCHLSVNDVPGAIERLLLGDETTVAYALAATMREMSGGDRLFVEQSDLAMSAMSRACARVGLFDEALQLLKNLSAPRESEFLMLAAECALYHADSPSAQARLANSGGGVDPDYIVEEFYASARVAPPEDLERQAEALVAEGRVAESVLFFVAARQYDRAVDIGRRALREFFEAEAELLAADVSSLDEQTIRSREPLWVQDLRRLHLPNDDARPFAEIPPLLLWDREHLRTILEPLKLLNWFSGSKTDAVPARSPSAPDLEPARQSSPPPPKVLPYKSAPGRTYVSTPYKPVTLYHSGLEQLASGGQVASIVHREFLAAFALLGCLDAMDRGFASIVPLLARTVWNLVESVECATEAAFPLDIRRLWVSMLLYTARFRSAATSLSSLNQMRGFASATRSTDVEAMRDVVSKIVQQRPVGLNSESLQKVPWRYLAESPTVGAPPIIIPSGSNLPSGSQAQSVDAAMRKVSMATGLPIIGAVVVLEDGQSFLSVSEAKELESVAVFSPLNQGAKLRDIMP